MTSVWICDKCKNEWISPIKERYHGYDCPKCNESKGEKTIAKHLIKHGVPYEPQYKFEDCIDKSPLRFDFFVINKFLIEYQGEQHYMPVRFGSKTTTAIEVLHSTKRRDQIKRDWCKKNNIPLIEIPYWDFNKIEDILKGQIAIYCDV